MKAMIDTNVLVYDAIENSPFHVQASELIDDFDDPLVNSVSLVELGFVLPRYGIATPDIKVKLDEILQNDWFSISWISSRMLEGASALIAENKLSFKEFNDWIIAYDAQSRKVPLVTFDKNLANQCKKLVLEVVQ